MIEPRQSSDLTAEDSFLVPKWYSEQMEWVRNPKRPENSAYNYPLALRMRGSLDRSALEQSIHCIVRRHPVLRSVFRIQEGRLVQIVLPPQPVPLPIMDLSSTCEAQREAEALRRAVDDANQPFDLSHGPLLRATLIRVTAEDHVLLLTTHHIASDDWSSAILLRDLSRAYNAFSARQPSCLPEISSQYGDYLRRQQKRLEQRELECIAFWKQQLADADDFQHLAPDHIRAEGQSYHGTHERLILDESLTSALKTLCQKETVTPFMALLAALQCLLCRYSGREDIGVASCVANRTSVQADQLVGHFSNHVIFRTHLTGDPTLREVLRRVRLVTLTAHSYQDLPFGSLVEQLDSTAGISGNRFFQAMVVLTDAPRERWSFSGLNVNLLPLDLGTTPYDLILWLKLEDRLEVDLQYNCDLFEVATIRHILETFRAVLCVMSKNPELRVGQLEIARVPAENDNLQRPEHQPQGYMRTKDSIESQLVRLWEAAFDKRPIGVNDNFFELGGDSLLAARLFAQIEETFKVRVPLVTLVQAPTIEKLAPVIRSPGSSGTWHSLVAIQAGGVRPPLFCIHGESGSLLMYRRLAQHLGSDQPTYGLQPQGLDGRQAPLTRIEDMAARYVTEVQVIQPQGPYFLLGYCMGGTIAFEMAQQLSRQGKRVDLLALLDTYNWRMTKRTFLHQLYFNIQKCWFSFQRFIATSSRDKLSSLQTRFGEPYSESKLAECNRRAAYAYIPKVYRGRMLHVRPTRQYAIYNRSEMGWDELVAGCLEVFSVPSYPAQVVEEPFVRDLAIKLTSCITEAIERGNSLAETDVRECGYESVSFSSSSTAEVHKTLCDLPAVVEQLKA